MTPNTTESSLSEQPGGKRAGRKIDDAFETIARLSGSNLPPTEFYSQYLMKVIEGIDALAGAVWIRTPQGFLQLQHQHRLDDVGLDRQQGGRQAHNELLRQGFQTARPMLLGPGERTGIVEQGGVGANPTEYICLVAPILSEDGQKAVGILEVWQDPRWDARVQRTFLNYLIQMAGYASNYIRHIQSRMPTQTEQVWTQLETFLRTIHASTDPTETGYFIANDGRRIIGCDRLSVGIRLDRKVTIAAVSGADVVEKRSTMVRAMRLLGDAVIEWGEKLVYRGTKDETLPPNVLTALDEYLAESNSKLLVVMPLTDERDKPKTKPGAPISKETPKKPRSVLFMECYEPPNDAEHILGRLDVIAPHATTALYNAIEFKRIPLGFLWRPVAAVQRGLGGQARMIFTSIVIGIAVLLGVLVLVPYPLKLEAKGQLLPEERAWVYSTREGVVQRFLIDPASSVAEGHPLITMYDPRLEDEIQQLRKELNNSEAIISSFTTQTNSPTISQQEKTRLLGEIAKEKGKQSSLATKLTKLQELNNSDANQPGHFRLMAPKFSPSKAFTHTPQWTVLNADFKENLSNKQVKPNEPLLRLGDKNGIWELELKIPQKHVGQVLRAFDVLKTDELDVDLLLTSMPTSTFRGKLHKTKMAVEAVPNRDDHNESEPIVTAYVRVSGEDIPKDMQLPRDQLVTGVEVHAKVRCGNYSSGYSLFYGVWEFLYEKVYFYLT